MAGSAVLTFLDGHPAGLQRHQRNLIRPATGGLEWVWLSEGLTEKRGSCGYAKAWQL